MRTTIVTAAGLRKDSKAFLQFKRAMGVTYQRGEFDLNRFVYFVAQRWGEHGQIALDLAVKYWCERLPGRKAVTLANEFAVVRQLCVHRRRRDPTSYVPEHALAPVKESTFFPYIFSATTKCAGFLRLHPGTRVASSGHQCYECSLLSFTAPDSGWERRFDCGWLMLIWIAAY